MKPQKYNITMLISLILSILLCVNVFAAEDRTPIRQIQLTIQSTIQSGSNGDVTATTSDNQYRVSDIEILNEDDNWSGGMRPRVAITLYAQSGYYFYSSSKSMFSFSGEDATYVTSKRDGVKTEITVTILLNKLENGDLSVSGVQWDESSAIAMWDENPSAKYYHVRLYRDGKSVASYDTSYNNDYEFAGKITRQGEYHFEVRAIGSGSQRGEWESSDTWYISAREADDFSYNYSPSTGNSSSSGGPGATSTSGSSGTTTGGPGSAGVGNKGSWSLDQYGWWYRNADNSYSKNAWQVIDGKYYFFNESGYMRTGWIFWTNKWYYCGPDGSLWANARTPDGYYIGGDGVWVQ